MEQSIWIPWTIPWIPYGMGLYQKNSPSPIWNPCSSMDWIQRSLPCPSIPHGIHVVSHGICPFHMEYVLAEISHILVISFHLYSMWIPCGFHHSIWNFHQESIWNVPHEFHPISMWIPCGFHLESPTTNIRIIEIIVQINTKQ